MPGDLDGHFGGLRELLLNALQGISLLTDEVNALRQESARLQREAANNSSLQAAAISSLQDEVRALRSELGRRKPQYPPSRNGYERQSDGSWFDQGPPSPWILAKTSARPRIPRRLFPCCRPQQTGPPPLKSARVTRADLFVKWPSERIPAQQLPVCPVDPPGKPCLHHACTLTPLCPTFSGLEHVVPRSFRGLRRPAPSWARTPPRRATRRGRPAAARPRGGTGEAPAAPAPYLNEPRPARRDLHGGLPPPAAEIRRPRPPRTVATWVCQAGNEPLHGYFSAAAWSGQVRCEVGLQLDRVPQVFRGRTLADHGAAFPGGVATPDPGARYCAICGLLVVAAEYHETSERHKAAVEAARAARAAATGPRRAPAAASAAAALDVDTVRARMRADPAFAAAILAPAAAEAGGPAGFAAAGGSGVGRRPGTGRCLRCRGGVAVGRGRGIKPHGR
ncbi:hypothetical protein HPB48_026066 [Haemaphysalis longicornis]|uniref:Uncharacterized protein n=1 Tax=Haemaphysalis longicornis TaxID=44386 RepID=A0A9J6H8P9_HAELO|nr:hypothetical protein HPB48_026066 [Haemaphysalis longicornis]